jgi:hypothetical protein
MPLMTGHPGRSEEESRDPPGAQEQLWVPDRGLRPRPGRHR